MKITSVEEYSKLSQEEVKGRLAFLNEANTSEEPDKLLTQLKKEPSTGYYGTIMLELEVMRSCYSWCMKCMILPFT